MTRDNAKDYLPFMQALADGKTIQFATDGIWMHTIDISFQHAASFYRIKPEQREFWLEFYTNGNRAIADNPGPHVNEHCVKERIHVREVLE